MTFDLTGVTLPIAAEVGLAMWAASILPDKRLDWRFVDFGLGLMETTDFLLGEVTLEDCPYVELFARVATVISRQRGTQLTGGKGKLASYDGYQISGGVGVLAAFDYRRLQSVKGKLSTCPVRMSLSFATSLIGFTELAERLGIAPNSATDEEAAKTAKRLGIFPGPQRDVADALLGEVSRRPDVPADFREYVDDWTSRRQRMFAPTTRTEYLDHKQAFSGLKDEVET